MDRRTALQHLFSAAALSGLPAPGATLAAPPLPENSLFRSDPEKYWARIREEQFLLPGERIFLNNGSLGVTPKAVLKAVVDYMEQAAALLMKDMGDYPRWGYETLDAHREELAGFLGCRKQELALTHNATEALSTIAAGLDLRPGDEVIMTDQEHPSGRSGWLMKQARYGVAVREVKIPLPPRSPEQLADIMVSAIGPRTRVVFFSGITTTTGLIFPVRQICDAARAKGLITVVDGAHMNGQVPLKLSGLGCDLYAGSPHKWMFAPAGCGILYVREEMQDRLWPSIVTGDWNKKQIGAARYMQVGTNNRAIFEGLIAGLRFGGAIGFDRVYARIHQLARMVCEQARKRPYLELLTPDDDRMFGSLAAFQIKGVDLGRLAELCEKRRIWILRNERLRISTHVHTRPADIHEFFETLDQARA